MFKWETLGTVYKTVPANFPFPQMFCESAILRQAQNDKLFDHYIIYTLTNFKKTSSK